MNNLALLLEIGAEWLERDTAASVLLYKRAID